MAVVEGNSSCPQTGIAHKAPEPSDELALWGPQLLQAVEGGDADRVRGILKVWPEGGRARKAKGPSLLQIAVQRRDLEIAELLIKHGAQVNADHGLCSPLIWALKTYCPEKMVALLLRCGANPNAEDGSRRPALWYPLQVDDVNVAKLLIQHGASPELIYYPVHMGKFDMVKLMLDLGASVAYRDSEGATLAHYAAQRGHRNILSLLISKGIEVNATTHKLETPLDLAIREGFPLAAKVLRKHGAVRYVELTDSLGRTMLHLAAEAGNADDARAMLANGGDVDARDQQGRTPLHLAAAAGHDDLVKMLVASGAAVDARMYAAMPESGQLPLFGLECTGPTPLHLAVRQGYLKTVTVLLEAGAEADAPDGHDKPLHLAAEAGCEGIVAALLAAGADVKAKDKKGWNALDLAVVGGHEEVAKLLRSARPAWNGLMEPPHDPLADLKTLIAKLGEDSCAEDLAVSDKGLLAALADLAERIEHLEYLSRHGRRRNKPKGRGRRAKKPEAAAQQPPKPPSAPIPQGKSFRARMLEKLGWTLELLSYGSIEEAKADLGFTMAILAGEPIEDCDGTSYRDYAQDIPVSLRKEAWELMAKARGALVAGKQGCDREAIVLLSVVLGKLKG